jgi:transcriptional regulator with XRE-family HTH domain
MTHTAMSGAAVPRPRKRLEWHDQYVGEVLRRARIDRGLSQAEAARDFGLPMQSYISKIERGARHVHPHELALFAELYGRTLQSLEREIASGSTITGQADRVPRTRTKRRFEQQYLSKEYEEVFEGEDEDVVEPDVDSEPDASGRADTDALEMEDPWEIENPGPPSVTYPHPLRLRVMPASIPDLGLADQRRRDHLSHLLDLMDVGALRGLSAEWLPVLDAYGREGTTPLYEAVVLERYEAIAALVALGADPRRVQCFPWAADVREVTPLNAAARTSRPGPIARLLCCDLPPSTILNDCYSNGPIHDAAFLALPGGKQLLDEIR